VAGRVLRLVGRPDLVEQPWFPSARERVAHVDELDGAVQAWIGERDLDAVVAAFEEVGAALFPVYDVAQLFADPQVQARDAVTTVDDEDLGPLRMQNVWFRLSRTPGRIRFPGRRLGQDTDAVLTERLGYTPEQVAALRKDGVV
jgi:crotonobetainyl-CoA:carnitine CoA-transferase CaiB-like acyl-CoA transferase